MAINKTLMDLLVNGGIVAGIAIGGYFAYTKNFLGIRSLIDKAGSIDLADIGGGAEPSRPTGAGGAPPTGAGGFEQGYDPNLPPIPAGAPGGYQSTTGGYPYDPGQGGFATSDPNYPYGIPNIGGTPQFLYGTPNQYPYGYGGGYDQYGIPSTGVGTIPGTNVVPYPNPCPPGFYRASDLKCYPIPTQFPGSGCGPGMYLANDGRCYNYPSTGVGAGFPPVPCPIGEYRASDGRCYQLPTPPPGDCPTGQYRASDGKCYPLTGGTPPPAGPCPTGQYRASDGQCYPYPSPGAPCPTGQYRANDGNCYPYPPGQGPSPIPPLILPIKRYSMFIAIPQCADLNNYTRRNIDRNWSIATEEYIPLRLRPDVTVCQGCGICPSNYGLFIEANDSEDFGKGLQHGFVPATNELLSRYYISPGGSFSTHVRSLNTRFTAPPLMIVQRGRRILNR